MSSCCFATSDFPAENPRTQNRTILIPTVGSHLTPKQSNYKTIRLTEIKKNRKLTLKKVKMETYTGRKLTDQDLNGSTKLF